MLKHGSEVSLPGQGIVSEKKPEAEDGLCENVENGVRNNLSIDANVSRSIGDTPDTRIQVSVRVEKNDREKLTLDKWSTGST